MPCAAKFVQPEGERDSAKIRAGCKGRAKEASCEREKAVNYVFLVHVSILSIPKVSSDTLSAIRYLDTYRGIESRYETLEWVLSAFALIPETQEISIANLKRERPRAEHMQNFHAKLLAQNRRKSAFSGKKHGPHIKYARAI